MTICDNCIHNNVCGLEGHLDEAMTFCVDKVSDVTRQSARRGRWEHNKCTECKKGLEDLFFGEFYYDEDELNFCPNCGADMRDVPDTDVAEIANVVEFRRRMSWD